MTDNINHPLHYEKHKMVLEPIDVLDRLPFALGSCIKYVVRAKDKGNELEDMQKAIWYHKRFLTLMEQDQSFKKDLWPLITFRHSDVKLLHYLAERLYTEDPVSAWLLFGNRLTITVINLKKQNGE